MSTRNRENIWNYNCFFVTTTFRDWFNLFINGTYYKIVIDSLLFCLEKYNSELIAYVLMPNHIHLIILFNAKPLISDFMRDFKKFTSTKIRVKLENDGKNSIVESLKSNIKGQAFQIWQNRYDAKVVIGSEMLLSKIDYIHNNPVKKGIVEFAHEWKYSSANFYFNETTGILPIKKAHEII